jgi:hypothetical protein
MYTHAQALYSTALSMPDRSFPSPAWRLRRVLLNPTVPTLNTYRVVPISWALDIITSMPVTTFERELKSFKARLTQSEQSTFTDTTIDDLHLTVASIQKTQISERTNKNITRLRTFLEAIESLSKILDLFVNISDFVAFVWGPIKYLLLVSVPRPPRAVFSGLMTFFTTCRSPVHTPTHLLHSWIHINPSVDISSSLSSTRLCSSMMVACKRFWDACLKTSSISISVRFGTSRQANGNKSSKPTYSVQNLPT